MLEDVKIEGFVEIIIDYEDGSQEVRSFHNTVLKLGKYALAASLAQEYGGEYQYYITNMLFGTGGTDDGVPKYVRDGRTGLFTYLLSKPVAMVIDPSIQSQVIFTSVLTKSEANINPDNPQPINEMALMMANGQLYSMATFPDISKTNLMQLTFNWRISFI